MVKEIALRFITWGFEFAEFYADFRKERNDSDRKNYQVAIRSSGIVIKHLPTEVEKHYLRI